MYFHLYFHFQRPDSGIGILPDNHHHDNNHAGTPRSIIADLKLKLAMKDTEMHKLKAIVANNSILQQKLKSGLFIAMMAHKFCILSL